MIDRFKGEHRWLSNFWIVPITAFGYGVDSVEHGYQAAKAKNSSDRVEILTAETPGKAKRMGQKIEARDDWDTIKEMVMITLLRRKYADTFLKKQLLETGTQELIEGNSWSDRYWGCVQGKLSMSEDVPTEYRIQQPGGWIGLNRLGRLTMDVRREIHRLDGL